MRPTRRRRTTFVLKRTSFGSGVTFIVTGLVPLLAAGVDALSRRRAAIAGLR